jgi:hypothetical protein
MTKLIIYTYKKKWVFDFKDTSWKISDSWVEVRQGRTTYFIPVSRINFMMVTEKEVKEEEKK